MDNTLLHILESKNLKPTSNRMLVLKEIASATHPISLADIESGISTMYKSTIFRVLNQFIKHDVVHTIDDGTGSLKYELCHGKHQCSIDDMHVHFFCEKCQRTICLDDIQIPRIELPEGYTQHSANFVIKGICDSCR